MKKFVSREKMSKKDRKKEDARKRATWAVSPVTKRVESKKVYNRKRISRAGDGDGTGDSFCFPGREMTGLTVGSGTIQWGQKHMHAAAGAIEGRYRECGRGSCRLRKGDRNGRGNYPDE